MRLSELKKGEKGVVVKVLGHGGFRKRIVEMGFIKGKMVEVLLSAPLRDPVKYRIMGYEISLRREEASMIEIISTEEAKHLKSLQHDDVTLPNNHGLIGEDVELSEEQMKRLALRKRRTINVALVGNPNCGKTSLFNIASGAHEHVGNYSGVTVDAKEGHFEFEGYTFNIVDLPGTYSLSCYSPEELYVRKQIVEKTPDIVINVVDASNLERNLYLTTQLIDMNIRMVMALNMYDELEKKNIKLDVDQLEKMLGFPCVPTNSKDGKGIDHVLDHIISVYEDADETTKHIHINYGANIEKAIAEIKPLISEHHEIAVDFPFRYVILKLLENDATTFNHLSENLKDIAEIRNKTEQYRKEIEKEYREDIISVITNVKYGFINGALKETMQKPPEGKENGYKIDDIITNKWLGYPILLLFLLIMFEATFTLGAYPQEWIEAGVEWLGEAVSSLLGEGILKDLLVDGIIAGVGGVIVFLPNIVILFFFIAMMEDTGYMARAAFIMDKLMHQIGLHGKSFIPMLTGFGCGVPAIMATRTLENPKDRIVTMLAIPFMSCSARLPAYILIISAFFEGNKSVMMLSIYLIGIAVAILTALLLKKTAFKNNSEQFVMELPPYRIPTVRNILIHMWEKALQYLKKMGTVILVASIIIWALCTFPKTNPETERIDGQIALVEKSSEMTDEEKTTKIGQLEIDRAAAHSENSYIGKIGKAIEPIFNPLGFDWKMSVSLLSGAAAKEIVVSSMGVLYHADLDADEDSEGLVEALRSHQNDAKHPITPIVAFAFMVFILLYYPCIAAVTAIAKESSWKWAIFEVLYSTAVAWIASFTVYKIGSLFL